MSKPATITGLAAAILAGGSARRMGGFPKGLIEVEGHPIIERLRDAILPLTTNIIIIANDPAPYAYLNMPIIADVVPGIHGPLEGIATALAATDRPRLLVTPCDMPFLSTADLRTLVELAPEQKVVMASSSRGVEPLVSIFHTDCLSVARMLLSQGIRRPVELLYHMDGVTAPPGLLSDNALKNINIPDDL